MCSCYAGTINSWVVIFILPINSALNPMLYTMTTSFFREKVELLICRWQRSKSLTSNTVYMGPSRRMFYHSKGKLSQISYPDIDAQYGWWNRIVLTSSSTASAFYEIWKLYYRKHNRGLGLQVGSMLHCGSRLIFSVRRMNAEFLKRE